MSVSDALLLANVMHKQMELLDVQTWFFGEAQVIRTLISVVLALYFLLCLIFSKIDYFRVLYASTVIQLAFHFYPKFDVFY